MASSSSAPPSGEPLPAPGSLYWEYLEAVPLGAVIAMDLKPDSEELIMPYQLWQFSVKKVHDGEWRLLDGGGRAT